MWKINVSKWRKKSKRRLIFLNHHTLGLIINQWHHGFSNLIKLGPTLITWSYIWKQFLLWLLSFNEGCTFNEHSLIEKCIFYMHISYIKVFFSWKKKGIYKGAVNKLYKDRGKHYLREKFWLMGLHQKKEANKE